MLKELQHNSVLNGIESVLVNKLTGRSCGLLLAFGEYWK
jgi:hypothetical protein